MSDKPVAVVTGANRGLGFETCRRLGALGYSVVLTARSSEPGERAAVELRDAGHDVRFQSLDVRDVSAVDRLADFLADSFGRLDALVNNAGVFPDPAPGSGRDSVFEVAVETIREAFETNTLGALQVCRALVPLMQGRGNIVNVSSGMGQLGDMNGCCPGYRLSKTALNAVTRIFADELQGTGIKVNSVCPGWVRTDMGGANANLSVEEGAKGIVWAATLSADGPTGGFFRHGERIAW